MADICPVTYCTNSDAKLVTVLLRRNYNSTQKIGESEIMNKAAGTVVAIVVVAGVAWAGASWYTGTRVEAELNQSIERANAQMLEVAPEWAGKLSLASFEKGVFSSHARYLLTLPDMASKDAEPGAAAAPAKMHEIVIADRIEHGPFPMSRIAAGGLTPVMATSNFELERNASVEEWFKHTNGAVPMSGQASLGYGGAVDGKLSLAPVNYETPTDGITFSGLDLNFDVNADRSVSKLDGDFDHLSFKTQNEQGTPTTFEVRTVVLNSDMRGMFIGQNEITAKTLTITVPDSKVEIADYAQRMDLKEADNKVSGSLGYEVGQVRVNGADLASGQFLLRVKDLDAAAITRMSEIYRESAIRAAQADGTASPEATPQEQQAFMDAVMQSLAGNPTLEIDPLLIKTAKGEGRFNLKVDLKKPADPAMTMDAIVAQMVSSLDARLVVSKPMLTDLLAFQATSAGAPADAAQKQAAQQSEMIGMMSQQMGAARVDGENIVSTLSYSKGEIDFNGKKMPVEDFAGSLLSMVLGGGMAVRP